MPDDCAVPCSWCVHRRFGGPGVRGGIVGVDGGHRVLDVAADRVDQPVWAGDGGQHRARRRERRGGRPRVIGWLVNLVGGEQVGTIAVTAQNMDPTRAGCRRNPRSGRWHRWEGRPLLLDGVVARERGKNIVGDAADGVDPLAGLRARCLAYRGGQCPRSRLVVTVQLSRPWFIPSLTRPPTGPSCKYQSGPVLRTGPL